MSTLDPDRWRSVGPYLDQALELPLDARAAWIATLEAQQPALAADLRTLLREHEALDASDFLGGQLLDEEALDKQGLNGRAASPSLAGRTLGAYTLVSRIGHGGMGDVWLAERSDGRFEGRAAVKLLSAPLMGAAGQERFTREGTILARLQHPSIAHLIDAGVSPDGQPYLVLEHVQGEHIDRYCDERALGIDARVRLFLNVLAAVAHAHVNLVVHRDIKPSNVLVRTDDPAATPGEAASAQQGAASGTPRVALLDFGIAKLLEEEPGSGGAGLALTREHGVALTPEFAAPEQLTGRPVTTATDVYSLGVLLYVLLSGQHPAGTHLRSPAELIAAVVDTEPPRLSEIVASTRDATALDAETLTQHAARRHTTPEQLRHALRGDLDTIVTKALKKDANERYPSVSAFADDLRAYLAQRPISARPDTLRYRATKFVRRNFVAVSAVAAVMIALATTTAIATDRMFEARRQRDEARYQARRATASSEFMRNLVSQIGSKPVTMRDVLDRGRQALEQQYGHDTAFVARMLNLLSGPYGEMGDHATATAITKRALELATQIDDPSILAGLRCGLTADAVQERNLPAANAHLAEARRQLARIARPTTGLLVECESAESQLADSEKRFDDAIAHAQRGAALVEKDGEALSSKYSSILTTLALSYGGAGQLREAVATIRKMQDVTRQIGRGRTVSMVTAYHNAGTYQRALGWWLTAERDLLEGIAIARGINSNGQLPPFIMQNYGRTLILLGRRAEGKDWLLQMLARKEAAPRQIAAAHLSLTVVLIDEGDLAGARDMLQQAIREMGSTQSPRELAFVALIKARMEEAEGRIDAARAMLADAIAADGYPAAVSPQVHELLEYAARLALQTGQHDQAREFARAAVAACDRHFGTQDASAYTGRAHWTHGLALIAAGRTAEGSAAIDRGIALISAAAGPNHPWVQEARTRLTSLSR